MRFLSCNNMSKYYRLSKFYSIVLGTFLILFASIPIKVNSDTLVIPDISTQSGNTTDNTPRPARAMTMDQVRDQFGSPQEVIGPIGDPPITRWIYNNFVVTFESEYVIHSANKRN